MCGRILAEGSARASGARADRLGPINSSGNSRRLGTSAASRLGIMLHHSSRTRRATAPLIRRRLRRGDIVSVYRIDPRNGPFIEGRGTIEGDSRRRHFFYVRFEGEKCCRLRFVHPDFQDDAERSLTLLRAFWKASLTPPAIDEFFPPLTPRGGVP